MSDRKEKFQHLSLGEILKDRRLKKRLRPAYIEACRFFACPLVDRTETLDCGVDFEVLDKLENLAPTEKSFKQICDERAKTIFHQAFAENQKIQMLWSGGIDSTLALVSLYKVLRDAGELQRLEILLSEESIAEYPSFYENVIQPNLKYTVFTPPIYDYLDARKIIITGEHGDQLFGSDKAKYYILAGEAFRPYQEILPFMIARKFGSEKSVNPVMDFLAAQIKKSPIEIVTLFDYLWWLNFSLKWQHVALRLIASAPDAKLALGENLIHFFSAQDFQSWSISNHYYKIKKTWSSYKFAAKECIYDFHPDRNYLLHKEKEASLKDAILESPTVFDYIKRPFRNLIYRY